MTSSLSYAATRAVKSLGAMMTSLGVLFVLLLFYPVISTQALRLHDALFPIVTNFEILQSARTDKDQTVSIYLPGSFNPESVVIPKGSLEVYGRFYKAETTCEYKALTWYTRDAQDILRRRTVIFADRPPGATEGRAPGAQHGFGPWFVFDNGGAAGDRSYVEVIHGCDDGRLRRTLFSLGAFEPAG